MRLVWKLRFLGVVSAAALSHSRPTKQSFGDNCVPKLELGNEENEKGLRRRRYATISSTTARNGSMSKGLVR
jgi:hypothetical protein